MMSPHALIESLARIPGSDMFADLAPPAYDNRRTISAMCSALARRSERPWSESNTASRYRPESQTTGKSEFP
jgi:hypothetical protein